MAEAKSCIFCSIIAHTIPATIVAENDSVLVIKDIAPKAPIHYLIIPKTHITNLIEMQPSQASHAADMMKMAHELSQKLSGSKAFRLIINNGPDSGQSVFHLHAHFLSGKQMLDF